VHVAAGEKVDPELLVEAAAVGAAGVVKVDIVEMVFVAKEQLAMIAS
jgi:hypothetical protein